MIGLMERKLWGIPVLDNLAIALSGGVLLGLASSLHCACMCGGIASGYAFLAGPGSTLSERFRMLLTLQLGRISVYAVAGGLSSAVAALVFDPFASAENFRILQWLGAAVLMWVGLSMAGVLPRLAFAGDGGGAIIATSQRFLELFRGHRVLFPVAMGVSWGLTPCPMVYAALFSATLTGSGLTGSVWMLGFGLGTLPAVLASAMGITTLARYGRSPHLHLAAGLAIAGLGLASVLFEWPSVGLLCLDP